jgi:outer membrane protein OmpA-like peptidoglycan-associated protein
MRKSLIFIMAVTLGGLLAACADNTAEISKMSVKGGAYEKGLHTGYLKLAKAEHSEYDWGDAVKFEGRATLAAKGKPPAPEMLSARAIPKKHEKSLTAGYKRLNVAMAKGGALKAGKHAAAAQTNFDCWMQEAEENIQPKHIAACRNNFYGAMSLLEAAVDKRRMVAMKAPKKARKKKARKPQTVKYVLYFDFDSVKLSKSAKSAIDFIKADVKKGAKVSLAAFTDRAGSNEYNDNLSIKRAKTVFIALKNAGVKNELRTTSYGEERNAVATKDGVRQRLNRRVEISVRQ